MGVLGLARRIWPGGSSVGGTVLLCLAAFALAYSAASARDGSALAIPQPGMPAKDLVMVVDSQWASGYGYRPLFIRFEPRGMPTFPRDRRLQVTLNLRPSYRYRGTISLSTEIVLRKGTRFAETKVIVPPMEQVVSMFTQVSERGRPLRELFGGHSWGRGQTGDHPSVLLIDKDTPDRTTRRVVVNTTTTITGPQKITGKIPYVHYLAAPMSAPNSPMPLPGTVAQTANNARLSMVDAIAGFDILPLGEAPDSWLEYSVFDLVVVSQEDIGMLRRQYPQRFDALSRWASTGATLCVHGLPPIDDGVLEKLDSQLVKSDQRKSVREWRRLSPRVWERAWGEGHIRAVADEGALESGTNANWALPTWTTAVSDLRQADRIKKNRLGFVPGEVDNSYWSFLIPGVGMPPVNSFMLLITLFVFVIGPVNFFVLRRIRRRYLLLLTVPAGAMIVTLALLMYALVTDGLGVRVRVRSYTSIDQRAGESQSWSRQTYYAGLAPSQGLQFPKDTEVYPLYAHGYDWDDRLSQTAKRFAWRNDTQSLTSGYIRSRTTTQFMVVRSTDTERRLVIADRVDADGNLPIRNNLATPLKHVIIRTENDGWFWAENVAVASEETTGSNAVAIPATEDHATEFRKITLDAKPRMPPAMAAGLRNVRGSSWRSPSRVSGSYRYSQSMLERHIFALAENLTIREGNDEEILPPRTYVALSEESPLVPIGVERYRREASLHVIHGHW